MIKKSLHAVNIKLLRDSSIYVTTNLLNKAIPFLLLPVWTHYLKPEEFGLVATFTVIFSFISVVVSLSSHGSVCVEYYKRPLELMPRYITSALFVVITAFILVSLLFWLGGEFIEKLTEFPQDWLPIISIAALGNAFTLIILSLWQAEKNPVRFGSLQIFQTGINMTLSVIAVVVLGLGWQGRVEGQVGALVLTGILAIYILLKKKMLLTSISRNDISIVLKFGIPLIPHAMAGWLMMSVDKIFLNNYIGLEATGIYVIGYTIGMIIGLFTDAFNKAWAPHHFSLLSKITDKKKVTIVRFTYAWFLVLLLAAFVLSIISPWLLSTFFDPRYHQASDYVIWISIGGAVNGMYYMVVNYIYYLNKNYYIALITIISSVIGVIILYWFININGAVGAAQAMTLSSVITLFLTWSVSQRLYPMPWLQALWK